MFIVIDGLVTYGVTRTGSVASPGSTFTIPTTDNGSAIQAGDFMVLSDMVQSSTASVPSSVVPTGFTLVHSVTGASSDGKGMRHNLSYKIVASSDIGATRTGMTGSGKNRKNLNTFRMSRPIQSAVVGGYDYTTISTGVSSYGISIDPTAGSLGNCIVLVHAHTSGTMTLTGTPTASGTGYISPADANDTNGTAGSARSFYSYYPAAATRSIVEAGIFDDGLFNFMAGAYYLLS